MSGGLLNQLCIFISFNVKGLRRFYGPNKQTVGLQGHKNVPEKNPTKALLRRLGFFGG
jgi:hypothetical protein